jgi:hypothetical protein
MRLRPDNLYVPTQLESSLLIIYSPHSVFSATLLLSITALFREPKALEDLQL